MRTIWRFLWLIVLFFPAFLNAQVVTSDPVIFTSNNQITITFYASEGTAGLENYTGDVYAHTGVITNKSSSGSDWKYTIAEWTENTDKAKLTRLEPNVYSLTISPSVRQFYNVPTDETILQLAFVFRSTDGSKEGKDDGGKDIFLDVSQEGLAVKINSPLNNTIVDTNQLVPIDITAAENDSIYLYINNQLIKKTFTTTLKDTFTSEITGSVKVKTVAFGEGNSKSDSVSVFFKGPLPYASLPHGARKGIEILNDSTARLVLFAPYKSMVFVLGDFNNWMLSNESIMFRSGDYFWIEITDLDPEKEYAFQYYIDSEIYIADPYSNKILDPWNDQHIPDETYPDLKPYPEKGNGIISVLQTKQDSYIWRNNNFTIPPVEELVIYELLIRDFTEGPEGKEGNIDGVFSKIEYLDSLGINAVELMPFNEFEGNNSWGYNPSFYFATDKAYGTTSDYKSLIDTLHGRGMAVIMDIVLNHSYGQSPLVQMYFSNGKPAPNNPWYNVSSPNQTYSWGYDFDHDSPFTKEFVDSVLSFWINEYKVDGFRFDFTKGLTNTPGDGWYYDPSRVMILKRMADEVRKIKPDALLILEHLAENREEKVLANNGFLMWGNMNHNYAEASMGYNSGSKSDLSWGVYSSRDWEQPALVTYMESHDEERIMYKNQQWGNALLDYDITETKTGLKRLELISSFFFTLPGPKMIWQFGEYGYDYSIDYNGRVGKKPVVWDYLDNPDRTRVVSVYKELIHLKTTFNLFNTQNFDLNLKGDIKTIHLYGDTLQMVAVGNFSVEHQNTQLHFPHTGTWYDYFSGKSVQVNDSSYNLYLKPGVYNLFFDKPLKSKTIINQVNFISPDDKDFEVALFGNPVNINSRIIVKSRSLKEIEIKIFDLQGNLLDIPVSGLMIYPGVSEVPLSLSNTLPQGIYNVGIRTDDKYYSLKFLKF